MYLITVWCRDKCELTSRVENYVLKTYKDKIIVTDNTRIRWSVQTFRVCIVSETESMQWVQIAVSIEEHQQDEHIAYIAYQNGRQLEWKRSVWIEWTKLVLWLGIGCVEERLKCHDCSMQ